MKHTADVPPCASLLAWIERADGARGIHFTDEEGKFTSRSFRSYRDLSERARRTAAGLAALGIGRGQIVAIVDHASEDFVACFFGALLAGAVPSPMPPPNRLQDTRKYLAHLGTLLSAVRPALLVARPELLSLVRTACPAHTLACCAAQLAEPSPGAVQLRPDRRAPALVQFTSGSTGFGKALRLSHGALETNVQAIQHWLDGRASDAIASWLPVHHDMGLVGCFLWPLSQGLDLWLMTPEQFLRRPSSYLRCLSGGGATVGAIPPFALDYIAQRVSRDQLDGCDFAVCRAIVIGAERIAKKTLSNVLSLLAPLGLASQALVPAYGMAEATCAIAGVTLCDGWDSLSVAASALSLGRNVFSDAVPTSASIEVVSCGRPLAGVALRIVDEHGGPAAEGEVGEIVVRSSSFGVPLHSEGERAEDAEQAELATGDAGFLSSGKLYVLGRIGDSLKVFGRIVFAEDIEQSLADRGLPKRQLVVLLGSHEGASTAVVVIEQADPEQLARARACVLAQVPGARVSAVAAPRGAIERTTSGKPRRRALWSRFVSGTFASQHPWPDAEKS